MRLQGNDSRKREGAKERSRLQEDAPARGPFELKRCNLKAAPGISLYFHVDVDVGCSKYRSEAAKPPRGITGFPAGFVWGACRGRRATSSTAAAQPRSGKFGVAVWNTGGCIGPTTAEPELRGHPRGTTAHFRRSTRNRAARHIHPHHTATVARPPIAPSAARNGRCGCNGPQRRSSGHRPRTWATAGTPRTPRQPRRRSPGTRPPAAAPSGFQGQQGTRVSLASSRSAAPAPPSAAAAQQWQRALLHRAPLRQVPSVRLPPLRPALRAAGPVVGGPVAAPGGEVPVVPGVAQAAGGGGDPGGEGWGRGRRPR